MRIPAPDAWLFAVLFAFGAFILFRISLWHRKPVQVRAAHIRRAIDQRISAEEQQAIIEAALKGRIPMHPAPLWVGRVLIFGPRAIILGVVLLLVCEILTGGALGVTSLLRPALSLIPPGAIFIILAVALFGGGALGRMLINRAAVREAGM